MDAADSKLIQARIDLRDLEAKKDMVAYQKAYYEAQKYHDECLRQYNEQKAGYETLKNAVQGYCNDISSTSRHQRWFFKDIQTRQ